MNIRSGTPILSSKILINLLLWPLFVVLKFSSASTELCPISRHSALNLSMTSRRNSTGHWTIKVDTTSEARRKTGGRPGPRELVVNVGQDMASCNDSETLRLILSTEVSPPFRVPVPSGYEVINGMGYYKMYTDLVMWEQAREKCVEDGGHLLVINSDKEADIVRTYFNRKPVLTGSTYGAFVFIGFHDRYTEGLYVTVLDENLDKSGYTKWDISEPNGGLQENCGLTYKSAKLRDGKCDAKQPFICEYHSPE